MGFPSPINFNKVFYFLFNALQNICLSVFRGCAPYEAYFVRTSQLSLIIDIVGISIQVNLYYTHFKKVWSQPCRSFLYHIFIQLYCSLSIMAYTNLQSVITFIPPDACIPHLLLIPLTFLSTSLRPFHKLLPHLNNVY